MVKKIIVAIGIILILFSLDMLLQQRSGFAAAVYFLAGLTLLLYSKVFEKVTNLVHTTVAIIYTIPLIMMLILAVYGNIHTTNFDEDVVFVLGAGLRDDEIMSSLEARLNQTLRYYENNPGALFIVCGGYGVDQTISEARAIADFLIAGGIPSEQILLEDASTSTYENFRFALEILDEHFEDGFSSVVVTNVFHQYRAGYLARHLGINPTRFGAATPFLNWHGSYMREILAVVNTWLFQT